MKSVVEKDEIAASWPCQASRSICASVDWFGPGAYGSVLKVQYGGTHHIVYGRTTSCVDRPVTRYLVNLKVPRRDVVCPLRY